MKNGSYAPVRLFDISESGVCVIAQVNLRQNLDCQLMTSVLLVPPTPTVLRQSVEVIYNVYSYKDGGFRTGLSFNAIDKNVVEEIRQYVNLAKPASY
ncbi:MAG: PilZ domain-containing protein [Methylomonas sp.]|nr:PilZ domain-containing protein [Methylomonas sp.]